MKLAAVTQIRNESKRLREWIEFHSSIHKFDHFLFFLDQEEDDSFEVLSELKRQYSIDIRHTRAIGNYSGNNCQIAVHRQKASFAEGYNHLKHDFDWIVIFDVDEFIVPTNLDNFDLKEELEKCENNIYYLPTFNFKPPFDYNKSIIHQNFLRWSVEEKIRSGHQTTGKSIIRGKIFLDQNFEVDVHSGPESDLFRRSLNVSFDDTTKFILNHFQGHLFLKHNKYEVFDDSLIRLFEKSKLVQIHQTI
jgi:hypothetical protein